MHQRRGGANLALLSISLIVILLLSMGALFALYHYAGRVEEEKRAEAEQQREEAAAKQEAQRFGGEKRAEYQRMYPYRQAYGAVSAADPDDEFHKATYFSGGFVREAPLTFIPSGENWTEGAVEFWVKPEQFPFSGNQTLVLFNWNSHPNPSAGYLGYIELMSDGRIKYHCGWSWGGGITPTIESKSSISLDRWTHVGAIWSPSIGTKLYLNNKLDSEISDGCVSGSNGAIYPWLAGYGGFVGAVDSFSASPVPVIIGAFRTY